MVRMYNILSHNMLDGLLTPNIDRSAQNMEKHSSTLGACFIMIRERRPSDEDPIIFLAS